MPETAVPSADVLSDRLFRTMSALCRFFETESAAAAAETLTFWLEECCLEDEPDAAEVAAWLAVFRSRGRGFARLAAACETWLDERV